MVIVLGTATARSGCFDELLTISREHVARSRKEPGCRSHAVHRDTEHAQRLVFVEEWDSLDALHQHFKVPASRTFAKAVGALSGAPATLQVYEATAVPV
jgi:quinol monooxygenase YgiN